MEKYGETLFVRDDREAHRLEVLCEVFDPLTTSALERLGVGPGSRCLEVGAGNGSIARWMAQRAVDGEVVATDIDASVLDGLRDDRVTALRHDVTRDGFPDGSFDVIHARLVLSHLPQRDEVLRRMRTWLAPGGVVLIESFCWFPIDSSPHPVYRQALRRWSDLVRQTLGTDSWWARSHPASFTRFGFRDVGANTVTHNLRGGTPLADFWRLTISMSHEQLVRRGYLSAAELNAAYRLLEDPDFWDLSPALVQAWGHR
ncbi:MULTISPECIES: class I SAM-dependent methyltransferase [unclassified Nocardiopsis]|uniref:class I SAM-dependent methyltransferase n=1 Tax=unclassified Nocardiopsis TaxID=2649073 RepID=UPI0013571A69|nr:MULTISPECIES: class I SAM-dependent methyltransferase [unclassified Nocardiopsis]